MPECIDTPALHMAWSAAPWDEVVCGYPVWQITELLVRGPEAGSDLLAFEHARDMLGAGLVSCRLPHDRLRESMLLEEHGFRFIEMVFAPEHDLVKLPELDAPLRLTAARAEEHDLPDLLRIAGTAFQNERFKMDARLDPSISDRRYQNWVASSARHASQQLLVLRDGARRVGFFVTELLSDGTCYWHLNAIDPEAQGRGIGRRAWLGMLHEAQVAGASRVRSSIVARNNRVFNLYADLGFRFAPPTMTFHWVAASRRR